MFSRKGVPIARVNPTPGPIHIGKDAAAVSVLCKKDGFEDLAGTASAEFQPMTLGNIVLGGLVGVIIDAGSGAAAKYPDSVTFTLVPKAFPSVAARDAFFEEMSRTFLSEYEAVVERINRWCAPADCEDTLRAAAKARTVKLDELQQMKLQAKVTAASGT